MLGRCMRAPFHARDLYVSRMAACVAGRGPVGMAAVSRSRSHRFYRSAGGDADADVCVLFRAAWRTRPPRPAGVGPRRQSVAIGRIDEDRPCEFGLDDDAAAQALGPRSRRCAVIGSTVRAARRLDGTHGGPPTH
ncbi:hypothetical protein D1007_06975 [Hordeum vulgare]|nr:hypothetical protein D1007_06975 [Hordeum vulgare]